MPHVQQMMANGTSFSNYFVTDSLCCPSRSSIFTGDLPHNTGVFGNTGVDGGYGAFNRFGNEPKSFGVAMQNAGYRTAMMGKYLNGYLPESLHVAPGWDEWDVVGAGYNEFDYTLNQNGTTHYYGSAPEDYLTDVLADRADSFIASSSTGQQPFMLEVAPFAPHLPATPAPRYADAVGDITMPRTPNYGTLPTSPPSWMVKLPPLTAANDRYFDDLYRTRVRADLAVDDLLGRVETQLTEQGIADNTYVVFSSDNGFHLGEYRLQPGKRTAFDIDIRVPLVVTGPGVAARTTLPDMVSNIDLAPTFAAIAGLPINPAQDGISILDSLHGDLSARSRSAVLVEHHRPGSDTTDPDSQKKGGGNPPDYEAIRTPSALLVRYTVSGKYEYYNLTKDPWELHNTPRKAPAALKQQLTRFITCQGAGCVAAAQ